MQVKKGLKVIYVSGNHGSRPNNPLHEDYPGVIGEIVRIDEPTIEGCWVTVKWSNGTQNGYNFQKDLEIVETKPYLKDKRKLKI